MVGIYKITNPKGRIYIGQSIYVLKRIEGYKNLQQCKNQPKLYNSLVKYGPENHIFEIIEECSIDELNDREIFWGNHFDVLNKFNLNLKIGLGRGNCSEETKRKIGLANKKPKPVGFGIKISNIMKGKSRKVDWGSKISDSLIGKAKSQSHRDNISKGKKGILLSEITKNKIKNSPNRSENISFSKSTPVECIETGERFRNIREVTEKMNISHTLVHNSCIKGIKAKGFSFIKIDKIKI